MVMVQHSDWQLKCPSNYSACSVLGSVAFRGFVMTRLFWLVV